MNSIELSDKEILTIGTKENVIYDEAIKLLTNKEEYDKMSKASNPYGDGHTSERIADAIIKKFSK